MCEEVRGLVAFIREKVGHTGENLIAYHCIIYQEALCGKVLDNGTCIDRCKQKSKLYSSLGFESPAIQGTFRGGKLHEDVPFLTEVHWISWGKVLRIFYDTHTEIARFMDNLL